MIRISMIVSAALALAASTAVAQTNVAIAPRGDAATRMQVRPQQAQAPRVNERAANTFIFDEYGNVYDSRGDIIKPRPLKH